MEDSAIIELYWARDEQAIEQTSRKYGSYCRAICAGILSDAQDVEESLNDTWIGAWNAMPPHRPGVLSTFLGKISRRVSLKKWRDRNTAKRGGGQAPLALEELEQCIPDGHEVDENLTAEELGKTISAFLRTLPETQRRVFVRRYWYFDDIKTLCRQYGITRTNLDSMLHRTRQKLREYLEGEGVFL